MGVHTNEIENLNVTACGFTLATNCSLQFNYSIHSVSLPSAAGVVLPADVVFAGLSLLLQEWTKETQETIITGSSTASDGTILYIATEGC